MTDNTMFYITISGESSYYAMMPRMAQQDLSNGAYKLYGVFKNVAGETGACWAGQDTLIAMMSKWRRQKVPQVSVNSIREWRNELQETGYIIVREESRDKGGYNYYVTVINRWDENRARFDAAFRQAWLREHTDEGKQWLYEHWMCCRDLTSEEIVYLRTFPEIVAYDETGDQKLIPKKISSKKNQEEHVGTNRAEAALLPKTTDEAEGQKRGSALDRLDRAYRPPEDQPTEGCVGLPVELHALELWIKKEIPRRNLTQTYREKLRKPVTFLPEGGAAIITAPSPIEMWDASADWRDFLAEKPTFLAEGNNLNVKALVNMICAPSSYNYFHKKYGISGTAMSSPAVTQQHLVDGQPLSDQEASLWSNRLAEGWTTERADDFIRSVRIKRGKQ